jgi:hypothetical protein
MSNFYCFREWLSKKVNKFNAINGKIKSITEDTISIELTFLNNYGSTNYDFMIHTQEDKKEAIEELKVLKNNIDEFINAIENIPNKMLLNKKEE